MRPFRQGDARNAGGAAYERLRRLIVHGLLAPGSPLIETDLVARLGVSRTPVRAALLRLEQEGFVQWAADGSHAGSASVGGAAQRAKAPRARSVNRRAIVAPLTASELLEIFLMLGSLEATAARQAAALDPGRRHELAAALGQANAALRSAVGRRPPSLVAAEDAHARFHRAIVEAAAGPRLRAEIQTLAAQTERYQRAYTVATMYAIDELAGAHDMTIAAIRDGDGDAAERATLADWSLTADRQREMVLVLGERGIW